MDYCFFLFFLSFFLSFFTLYPVISKTDFNIMFVSWDDFYVGVSSGILWLLWHTCSNVFPRLHECLGRNTHRRSYHYQEDEKGIWSHSHYRSSGTVTRSLFFSSFQTFFIYLFYNNYETSNTFYINARWHWFCIPVVFVWEETRVYGETHLSDLVTTWQSHMQLQL